LPRRCAPRNDSGNYLLNFDNSLHNFSSSFESFFGISNFGIKKKSHFLPKIPHSPNHFPATLTISQICVPFGILTLSFHSG
jgi:hypothetical protein